MRLRSTAPLAILLVFSGLGGAARANIDIVFDYTYDTGNFFSDPLRRNVLEAAALTFESRFTDSLTAITSGIGGNFSANFFNPGNAAGANITISNFSVAANELRVFAGGSALGGTTLGVGGPGGFGVGGSQVFLDNATSRGQAGALLTPKTDFGPWGGAISFNSASAWYFDNDVSTVETFTGLSDFYSVAVHELAHLLGFGTSASFNNKITSGTNTFTGLASGVQTLSGDLGHWASSTNSLVNGLTQQAAMTPSILVGTRKYFTELDFAGMSDIGWQVTPVPEPATWLMWGAGGVLLAGLRRRQAKTAAAAT